MIELKLKIKIYKLETKREREKSIKLSSPLVFFFNYYTVHTLLRACWIHMETYQFSF